MSQESPTRSSHVNACPGIDWGARSLSSYSPKPELRLCGPRLTRALRCPPLRPQHGASVYPAYVIHYSRRAGAPPARRPDEVVGQWATGAGSLVSRGEPAIRAAVRSFLDCAAAAAALTELQSTEERDIV